MNLHFKYIMEPKWNMYRTLYTSEASSIDIIRRIQLCVRVSELKMKEDFWLLK